MALKINVCKNQIKIKNNVCSVTIELLMMNIRTVYCTGKVRLGRSTLSSQRFCSAFRASADFVTSCMKQNRNVGRRVCSDQAGPYQYNKQF